jgi:transcriptional adapter 2-alpha
LIDDTAVNYEDLVKDEKGFLISKKKRISKKKKTNIVGTEIGFLQNRGDFNEEFENHAEDILAQMGLVKNDPTDDELKSKILEGYSFKLQEREKRKAFAIDRGFVDFKKVTNTERKRTREERDLYNKIKPFARFIEHEEFNDFYSGLLNEQMIVVSNQKNLTNLG